MGGYYFAWKLASALVCPIDFQPVPFLPASSSEGYPQPQVVPNETTLHLEAAHCCCKPGMETQNVLIMSAGEEGWGDPGLLTVLVPAPHGSTGALKPMLKPQIEGSRYPIPRLPFPPPHSGSQQRTKPETGANGIRSSPRPPGSGSWSGHRGTLRGMQRLCHWLILAPLCSENNPKAAGRKDAGGTAPRGLLPYKGLTGLV